MAVIKTPSGPYKYKKVFLYVGLKQIDREVALNNLKDLMPLFAAKGLRTGPIYGTLLGLMREGNFIEWDEDIDMYLLKEQEDMFRDALWDMRKLGFELIRYDKRGLYSIRRDGEYIDFYVLRSIAPGLRHMGGPDFLFEKYLNDTVDFDFKGVTLQIPRDYEEYLEFTYGDWRTPKRYTNYQPGKLKIAKMWLKDTIKNNLPDSLHAYLLKRVHAKDLVSFKQKCKAKGISIDDSISL